MLLLSVMASTKEVAGHLTGSDQASLAELDCRWASFFISLKKESRVGSLALLRLLEKNSRKRPDAYRAEKPMGIIPDY